MVRSDLSPPQICVQSGHAILEACKNFNYQDYEHPSIIILHVKNENKLYQASQYCLKNQIKHVCFYEPDRGNELTAFATEPIFDDRRHLFRRYNCLPSGFG